MLQPLLVPISLTALAHKDGSQAPHQNEEPLQVPQLSRKQLGDPGGTA